MTRIFNDSIQQAVAAEITRVERDTDAEIITVLARQADEYRWIGLFWAALAALLVPGIVLFFPGWGEVRTLLLIQWLVFVVLGGIVRLTDVGLALVPKRLRHERAAALARCQFLEQNLHATRHATGVLIFVSQAERYVEILADHGIAKRVDDKIWSDIVARFTQQVRAGNTQAGFVECIQACGHHLAAAVPATNERNELPNKLVILD